MVHVGVCAGDGDGMRQRGHAQPRNAMLRGSQPTHWLSSLSFSAVRCRNLLSGAWSAQCLSDATGVLSWQLATSAHSRSSAYQTQACALCLADAACCLLRRSILLLLLLSRHHVVESCLAVGAERNRRLDHCLLCGNGQCVNEGFCGMVELL